MSLPPPDWLMLAKRLARRLPAERLHPDVCREVASNLADAPLAVACSGGLDSVALLLLVHQHLLGGDSERLVVLHYNHATRGEESDQDQAFVAQITAGLEAPFHTARRQATGNNPPSEATLREARLAFFRTAMREADSRAVCLGHHRDDILETQILRLTRGGGLEALAAPRPVHRFHDGVTHLRPLLGVAKIELRAVLEDARIPWREDESNASDAYFRNRVRQEIIPALRQLAPADIGEAAARTRQTLEEDAQAIEQWLEELVPAPVPGGPLDLRPLQNRPVALWRRALHRWLQRNGLGEVFNRKGFEVLLEQVQNFRFLRKSAGPRHFLRLADGILDLERIDEKAVWPQRNLEAGQTTEFPDGASLRLDQGPLDEEGLELILSGEVDETLEAFLAVDALAAGPLVVRRRKPGDAYQPLGAPGTRKLQDLFTDRKIPLEERNGLPVVCTAEGTILWVPGLPPADDYALGPETTRALRLTYSRSA